MQRIQKLNRVCDECEKPSAWVWVSLRDGVLMETCSDCLPADLKNQVNA